MKKTNYTINVYTDGASSGNPGPGGYGIIMEWKEKNYTKEFFEGFRKTTNNRMELLAIIKALEKLKTTTNITIFTDSKYVIDAVEKGWLFSWQKTNFKKKKNKDLWLAFLELYNKHTIEFRWVKGHSGHLQNERCDYLATTATKGNDLKIDIEFEKNNIKK